MNAKQFLYLFLSFLTVSVGYAFLRYAYRVTDTTPFTREIVLIILGTVATIFITALLLNKQTSVEIEKQQNIKYLDLKAKTYERLFDILEELSLADKFEKKDLINLQFITHRLAIIASPEVLEGYSQFLQTINQVSEDNSFIGDTVLIHEALASLSIHIREDLTGQSPDEKFSTKEVARIIKDNSDQSATL